jgi:hypothetical protein
MKRHWMSIVAILFVWTLVLCTAGISRSEELSVTNPKEYEQVTISVPAQNIEATFYAYKEFKKFWAVQPDVMEREPRRQAHIIVYNNVDGYEYTVLLDPTGTIVVSLAERNLEFNTTDWYIVPKGKYARWATVEETQAYVTLMSLKWSKQYQGS